MLIWWDALDFCKAVLKGDVLSVAEVTGFQTQILDEEYSTVAIARARKN